MTSNLTLDAKIILPDTFWVISDHLVTFRDQHFFFLENFRPPTTSRRPESPGGVHFWISFGAVLGPIFQLPGATTRSTDFMEFFDGV